MPLTRRARAFLRDEGGATAIEYALIAGLISVAIVLGAAALGGEVRRIFDMIASRYVAAAG